MRPIPIQTMAGYLAWREKYAFEESNVNRDEGGRFAAKRGKKLEQHKRTQGELLRALTQPSKLRPNPPSMEEVRPKWESQTTNEQAEINQQFDDLEEAHEYEEKGLKPKDRKQAVRHLKAKQAVEVWDLEQELEDSQNATESDSQQRKKEKEYKQKLSAAKKRHKAEMEALDKEYS